MIAMPSASLHNILRDSQASSWKACRDEQVSRSIGSLCFFEPESSLLLFFLFLLLCNNTRQLPHIHRLIRRQINHPHAIYPQYPLT
jgi:hypothetical protein